MLYNTNMNNIVQRLQDILLKCKEDNGSRWKHSFFKCAKQIEELSQKDDYEIWLKLYKQENVPLCICGKKAQFHRWNFLKTCGSKECVAIEKSKSLKASSSEHWTKDPVKQKLHKERTKERTGYEHVFQDPEFRKNSLEKAKERHGENTVLRRKQTIQDRYGTGDMFSRGKQTMIEKYGVENIMHNDFHKHRIAEKMTQTKRIGLVENLNLRNKKYLETLPNGWVQYSCDICNKISEMCNSSLNYYFRAGLDPCDRCSPMEPNKGFSKAEALVYDWLNSIEDVKRRWLDYKIGEIDMFIKSRGIGFEFNGVYWHSELYKKPQYHIDKTRKAILKGIKIYHIWEDDFNEKPQIVKNRILALLGKNEKVYARKCTIREISNVQAREFFEANHIAGYVNSSIRMGLFLGETLVQAMAFSKSRYFNSKKGEESWELTRLAAKGGITVIGGASRLFEQFKKKINPEEVVSFCDISWSPVYEDTVYMKLGFALESQSAPNFYWVIGGKRVNRVNFQKHKLVSSGEDPLLTADEIMHKKKYYKIYDAGNWKFRWKRN